MIIQKTRRSPAKTAARFLKFAVVSAEEML